MTFLLRYVAAALIVAASTAAAEVFFRMTGSSRITSIFLASVLVSAFLLGSGPGFLAAGLSFVIYLYLVDPPYQLSFGSPDDFNSLILYLAAAVLTCLLAGRVRDEAAAAKARALTATSLLEATREFSATADEPFLRQRLAERLAMAAGGDALVRHGREMIVRPGDAVDDDIVEAASIVELAAAKGARDSAPVDGWTFRPLVADDAVLGVAGWRTRRPRRLSYDERVALDVVADAGAAAIARSRMAAAKADAETRARTEDLRNALLASISHDLRTPLSAIMASASSLNRFAEDFDAATRRDLAATIEEEAVRLDAFVSNLLQMTRLQSGAVSLRRISFSLNEVIQTAIERRAKGQAVRIAFFADGALPEAIGDAGLFEQAVGNVLENALRYGAPDGGMSVVARATPEALVVQVEDEGPGVPEEDLERIFEKFYRSERTARGSGTGLGLSIARGLVEAMGGTVQAHNRVGHPTGLKVVLTMPQAPQ